MDPLEISRDATQDSSQQARAEPGTLLQMARRLDWRFLLQDSALDNVAYVGEADGSLLAALRVFAKAVDVLDSATLSGRTPHGRYDGIVLEGPSRAEFRPARRLLRPSGHLYAEVDRRRTRREGGRPGRPGLFGAAAGAAGFGDVRLHWHWRTFDTCTRIIPLDDPTAFGYLAAAGALGAAARARAALGRGLLQAGALGWAVSCFSVVGRNAAD